MRIISWNINGIRTLPQYHPWNTFKSTEDILDHLEASIICFQEMKISRGNLERHVALPGPYDAFFSFPTNKGGYSGVAVYTDSRKVMPSKAEEGLSGILQPKPPLCSDERISSSYPSAQDIDLVADEDGNKPSNLMALDSEGRAMVLDFGLFVLINLYCPNEASDQRLIFKMNYHLMLQERVKKLVEDGREVIVLGDINICAAPLDHGEGHLASRSTSFYDHPARAWFHKWLEPEGCMIDMVRRFWPERKGMYTCWNTKLSARETNYGTRIDYILGTRGLLPWLKHGDIQALVKGSDHCPIYIDLHDEIVLPSGATLTLREAMKMDDTRTVPPRIAAKHWDEFSGKQTLLSTFFGKRESVPAIPTIVSPPPSLEEPSAPSATPPSPPRENDPPPPQATVAKRKLDITAPPQTKSKKQKPGQAKLSTFFAPKPDLSKPTSPTDDTTISDPVVVPDVELSQSQTASSSSSSSSQTKAAWSQLLAPIQPPKCIVHREPTKEFTVNKPGPNKGKNFFICSRPVGPGYDKGRAERLREEVDPRYRCNFFKWSSDVKRESLKDNTK